MPRPLAAFQTQMRGMRLALAAHWCWEDDACVLLGRAALRLHADDPLIGNIHALLAAAPPHWRDTLEAVRALADGAGSAGGEEGAHRGEQAS